MINLARLSEEAVELPELVLLPIVERVVVALRALNLHAKEQPSRLGGHLNAVVLILHLRQQEVHSPVLLVVTFRSH